MIFFSSFEIMIHMYIIALLYTYTCLYTKAFPSPVDIHEQIYTYPVYTEKSLCTHSHRLLMIQLNSG